VADLILSGNADDPLKTHRREIVVVFLDLRGFTAFSESADPEEVMGVLGEYHAVMGELITKHAGTLERFAGDGIMIFFNDPVPIPNPAAQAVSMALEMQQRFKGLAVAWARRGYDLSLGIGIAQGFATIGAIGFEGRRDYGAIGNVTNLAARLCGEAKGGQILVSQRVEGALGEVAKSQPIDDVLLKGFNKPIKAFEICWNV
jgi:class 3 adenylate cyclase